jgi:hypothetical protein
MCPIIVSCSFSEKTWTVSIFLSEKKLNDAHSFHRLQKGDLTISKKWIFFHLWAPPRKDCLRPSSHHDFSTWPSCTQPVMFTSVTQYTFVLYIRYVSPVPCVQLGHVLKSWCDEGRRQSFRGGAQTPFPLKISDVRFMCMFKNIYLKSQRFQTVWISYIAPCLTIIRHNTVVFTLC